jgi:Mg-dependent DNase
MLYDIHAHLETPQFDGDRDKVLSKCPIVVVNAGVDYDSNLQALRLSSIYPNVIPAAGFHPEYVGSKLSQLEDCLSLTERVRIISEVGLDYFWVKDQEGRKTEVNVFTKFLELAERTGKPMIVHVRGGIGEALSIISSYKVRFALHAFEGGIKYALKAVDMGGYISVPPILVRDRSRQEVVKSIPLDSILTETDSPFLGPTRDSRNEPCNVSLTLAKLTEILKLRVDEIEASIERNTLSFLPFLADRSM